MDHFTATDSTPKDPASPGVGSAHGFPAPGQPVEPAPVAAPLEGTAGQQPQVPPPPAPIAAPSPPQGATSPAAPEVPSASAAAPLPAEAPVVAGPGAGPGASSGPASAPAGIRGLFKTAVTLGPVLVIAVLTVGFVSLLFVVLHVRLGELDQNMQRGLEHTQQEMSTRLGGIDKELQGLKASLAMMQSKLPDAATRRRIESMATSVAAIEKQVNEWAAQEEGTEAEGTTSKSAKQGSTKQR